MGECRFDTDIEIAVRASKINEAVGEPMPTTNALLVRLDANPET
jgi:hypothetical protein